METKEVYYTTMLGIFMATVFAIMFGIVGIFNRRYTCAGTMYVGEGGITQATCINFNSITGKYYDVHRTHLDNTTPQNETIQKGYAQLQCLSQSPLSYYGGL